MRGITGRSVNYSKLNTINSLSKSTSKGRIFSQNFHSYSHNNIANTFSKSFKIVNNKPLISLKLFPLTSKLHQNFYSTSITPTTPKPPSTPSSPPSPSPDNEKLQINFSEILSVLKNGFFQLVEDRKNYPHIKEKKNKNWNDFHFMEQHELNMKKLIPFTLGILVYATVPFSLLTLPLGLIYGLPYIPSVFLIPYIKRKLFLRLAVELDNKESTEIIEKYYKNNTMINEFIGSHPFFTISEIEKFVTIYDKENSELRSVIETFFKKDNPRFEDDYLLTEDNLLREKKDGLTEEELILVCSKRKIYFKPKDNSKLNTNQLAVLLGIWLSSTTKLVDIPLATLSYPIFLSASNSLVIPEKLPTNISYRCLQIRKDDAKDTSTPSH